MKRILYLLLILSLCFISGFCVADADVRIEREYTQSETIDISEEPTEATTEPETITSESESEPETEEKTESTKTEKEESPKDSETEKTSSTKKPKPESEDDPETEAEVEKESTKTEKEESPKDSETEKTSSTKKPKPESEDEPEPETEVETEAPTTEREETTTEPKTEETTDEPETEKATTATESTSTEPKPTTEATTAAPETTVTEKETTAAPETEEALPEYSLPETNLTLTKPTDIDPTKPMVALTFDDGPSAHTDRLLDIFKKNGGRGTFFVVGYMIEYRPSTLKRIAAEGHEIGNHSWDHKQLTTLNKYDLTQQIRLTQERIYEITGVNTAIMRPPYGSYNDFVKSVGAELGVSYVNWSLDTLDWKTRNAQAVCDKIMSSVRNGSIILCHDIHKTTVDAMEMVIPKLIAEGYQLVTVSELLSFTNDALVPGAVYNRQ